MYVLSYKNRLGGALPQAPCIDGLPAIGLNESVHGISPEPDPSPEPDSPCDPALFPSAPQMSGAEDIVGAQAHITYDVCLMNLADFVVLPVKQCPAKRAESGEVCGHRPPFKVKIKHRGTASILEWVSNFNIISFSCLMLCNCTYTFVAVAKERFSYTHTVE